MPPVFEHYQTARETGYKVLGWTLSVATISIFLAVIFREHLTLSFVRFLAALFSLRW